MKKRRHETLYIEFIRNAFVVGIVVWLFMVATMCEGVSDNGIRFLHI